MAFPQRADRHAADPIAQGRKGKRSGPLALALEVANVLRNAVRRRRCDEGYATRCLQRLGRLAITIDPETDMHARGRTRQLSGEHDLTLYEAAYLELAIRRSQPLAPIDAALIAAARRIGLDVLGD